MTQRTITRADISEAIYQELGFSHAEAFKLIESTLNLIIEALGNGETVKISNFATLTPRKKRQRMGRNPKTGKEHEITPRTVVSYKASHTFKTALKKGSR